MNVLHLAKIIAALMPHVATQMVRMTVRVTEASLGMVSIVQVLAAVTGFMKKIYQHHVMPFFHFLSWAQFLKPRLS